jgi:hypothetical protein
MPFYKYFCEANGKTVEVCHPMAVKLNTWAAICLLAKIAPGETPPTAPVVRLLSSAVPYVPRFSTIDKEKPSTKLEL